MKGRIALAALELGHVERFIESRQPRTQITRQRFLIKTMNRQWCYQFGFAHTKRRYNYVSVGRIVMP